MKMNIPHLLGSYLISKQKTKPMISLQILFYLTFLMLLGGIAKLGFQTANPKS